MTIETNGKNESMGKMLESMLTPVDIDDASQDDPLETIPEVSVTDPEDFVA